MRALKAEPDLGWVLVFVCLTPNPERTEALNLLWYTFIRPSY